MHSRSTPLISVITPCLNAARHLEGAIHSVLDQEYAPFEHIVVDGGSADGTTDILERHRHLRWVSEPDRGQSDAMNKGFALSKGDVIVYLNADDYFERNAFHAVARAIDDGASFVVGRIRVIKSDGTTWINDPRIKLSEMLRWWELDSFCYNSAGYFYRRAVQETVGLFDVDNHFHMDYAFLLEAASRFAFTKIPDVLASFRHVPGTKSYDNRANEHRTMRQFDRYLSLFDDAYRQAYLRDLATFLQTREPQASQ